MKTATVRDLRNHYREVLDWVDAGEEVAISRRGRVIGRLVPEKPCSGRVDWAQSAAALLKRKEFPVLTARQSEAVRRASQDHFGA